MRLTLSAALLPALTACACQGNPAPVLHAVEPGAVPNDADAALIVRGAHFQAAIRVDFDSAPRSSVDARFSLELARSDGTRLALADVVLVSGAEIRARLPAGAPAAVYDLELADPLGRRAGLARALDVYLPCTGEGSPCRDGDLCTRGDVCRNGRCEPGAALVCIPRDECHLAGTCQSASGLCSDPPAPEGTPCQRNCISGETCQAGACVEPPGGCSNIAPLACLAVTPVSGAAGATAFRYDASCSADPEDGASGRPLSIRIDFGEAPGVPDWQVPPAGQPHVYAQPGLYSASAEVTDQGGLTTYASRRVVVYDAAAEVVVTTAADESDPGATPADPDPGNPSGTGLSLREAVSYVNAASLAAAIRFADSIGPVRLDSPLPDLTAPGAALVGRPAGAGLPAVQLDFGRSNQDCIRLAGPGQLLAWIDVTGCDALAVALTPASLGSRVTECTVIASAPTRTNSVGIDAQASGTLGPRNRVAGYEIGVRLSGTGYLVTRNSVSGGVTGILVAGGPGASDTVRRNRVFGHRGPGLAVTRSSGALTALHNVFDGNGGDGLAVSSQGSGATLRVRNNLFTGNAGYGVNAAPGSFSFPGALDHNGFFANGLGPLPAPLATGPTDVLLSPAYANQPAGDYRLLPGSPAVDAGADTGLDVNGPGPGRFDGAAPDLGSEETPY